MDKKTVAVHVKHNLNLQPIAGAIVHWSEHIMKPKDENHIDLDHVKKGQIATDDNGIANIETEIQASVKDAFNIHFTYLESVWVRVDFIESSGFKKCDVKKVFPPPGEEYEGIKGANHHEFTIHLIPET